MNLRLSSILLPILTVPIIMTYGLSAGETPYWLFGVIFLGYLVYILLDVISLPEKRYVNYKQIVFWSVLLLVLGSVSVSSIFRRHAVAPVFEVHDIILQQEAAINFLLDGVNPYATDYFGTHLEAWHYSDNDVNPALYHFVMQPFYLLFAVPFYGVAVKTIGFFDARIPLFLLQLCMLFLAYVIPKKTEDKMLFTMLLAFNPAMFGYTLEGRSDVFMYTFLFFGLYFLTKMRAFISGVLIGLAFVIKQSVWPLFPLYVLYLYLKKRSIRGVLVSLFPFIITCMVFTIPFIVWNASAYIESTILYLSGSSNTSYPISGYGIGMLLYELGIITDLKGYFPFTILQIIICLPVFYGLYLLLKKNPSVKMLIITYGILLFVFWYFSRYFNNSHVGFLTLIFLTAYFWPEDSNAIDKIHKK